MTEGTKLTITLKSSTSKVGLRRAWVQTVQGENDGESCTKRPVRRNGSREKRGVLFHIENRTDLTSKRRLKDRRECWKRELDWDENGLWLYKTEFPNLFVTKGGHVELRNQRELRRLNKVYWSFEGYDNDSWYIRGQVLWSKEQIEGNIIPHVSIWTCLRRTQINLNSWKE